MAEYLNKYQILDKLAENEKEGKKGYLEAKNGKMKFVAGALGELPYCNAFVEEEKAEPHQMTKYYGISYWWKGWIDNEVSERATITKRAFREIIKLWPLRIRQIPKSMMLIYRAEGGLMSKELKLEEFCPFCQELIKKAIIVKPEWRDLIYCVGMFLQVSPAFRFRLQDILPLLSKEGFERRPLTEILRLKHIFMGRELAEKKKMEFLWNVLFWVVAFKRDLAKEFVGQLNLENTKLDEADWYFCLRRDTYNFGGLDIKERLKMAEQIDKEKDHLILGI